MGVFTGLKNRISVFRQQKAQKKPQKNLEKSEKNMLDKKKKMNIIAFVRASEG